MAIRNIYLDGDPILRKKCRPVVKFDEKLSQILDDMHETLDKAGGVGLAAPQVGFCRRYFIMHLPNEEDPENGEERRIDAINPEILEQEGNQHVLEGCLSVPDKWGYVDRPERVKLRAQDRQGNTFELELFDLGAQCAVHENAHLDGQLFTDVCTEFVEPEEYQEKKRSRRKNH